MSENPKKIFKATTQHKLAQLWAEGKEADLKKQGALLQIRNGTITAITQSYDWSRGGWIQNAPITIAFTNDDGERAIYLQRDDSNSAFYDDSLSERNIYDKETSVRTDVDEHKDVDEHNDVDEVLQKTYPIKNNINVALIEIENIPNGQKDIAKKRG